MDKGCVFGMVIPYLQKAFDTVNHSIILMKLAQLVFSKDYSFLVQVMHVGSTNAILGPI